MTVKFIARPKLPDFEGARYNFCLKGIRLKSQHQWFQPYTIPI